MNKKIMWSMVLTAAVALSACGTVSDGANESGQTPESEGTTTGLGMTSGANPTTPAGDDGVGDSGNGAMTGGGFIEDPDGGGVSFECDIFAQDCPEGEKCMPWANDGSDAWNATRCSPVADNPGQPGDECTVEGDGTSGVDDCDIGAQCWGSDPETNVGTCAAMCTGDDTNPICEDPDTTCAIANDGAIVLCLPTCDPILQDCINDNDACYPINEAWTCGPDASGEAGIFADPCAFINVCDPGLVCLSANAVPGCDAGATGCCSEVCDLDDPMGDMQCSGQAAGQVCTPWYEEGAAPPGYENVGACALPA